MPIFCERLDGDDVRGDDLHEAGVGEGRTHGTLELDERGPAPVRAAPAGGRAGAGEHVLAALEGGVALGDAGERALDLIGVGAELAQALRLGDGQPERSRASPVGS